MLFLLAIVGLVWGLFAPHHIAKVARVKRDITRKYTSLVFAPLVLVLLLLIGSTAPQQPKTVTVQQASITKQPVNQIVEVGTYVVPTVTTPKPQPTPAPTSAPTPSAVADRADSKQLRGDALEAAKRVQVFRDALGAFAKGGGCTRSRAAGFAERHAS
jgi:hypothetical protein